MKFYPTLILVLILPVLFNGYAEESDITEVGVEHVPWYDLNAPLFKVTIRSDGTFTYVGERNVKHLGTCEGRIPTMDIQPLFQYVREMNFPQLSRSYSSGKTDQPTVYFSVTQGGKSILVKNQGNGGPLTLWALEKTIDGLLSKGLRDQK